MKYTTPVQRHRPYRDFKQQEAVHNIQNFWSVNFSEAEISQCHAIFNDQRKRRCRERSTIEYSKRRRKKQHEKPQNRKTKAGGKFQKARLRSNNNLGVKTFRDNIFIVRWQLNSYGDENRCRIHLRSWVFVSG